MSHVRHFIFQHAGKLDPNRLRDLIARQESSYAGCDIFDLRSLPAMALDPGVLTRDQALVSLILLRRVPSDWVRHRKAIVVLPAQKTDRVEICLAQMRAVGILGVIVAPDAEAVKQAQEMSTDLALASGSSFDQLS